MRSLHSPDSVQTLTSGISETTSTILPLGSILLTLMRAPRCSSRNFSQKTFQFVLLISWVAIVFLRLFLVALATGLIPRQHLVIRGFFNPLFVEDFGKCLYS